MKKRVIIEGRYYRKPLGAVNKNVSIPIGWFALPSHVIEGNDIRRRIHGKLFKIESKNMTIYRVLRFANGIKKDVSFKNADYILLDWVGWIDLCNRDVKVKIDLALTITEVTYWKFFIAGWKHPEPMFRLSVKLAVLSVALGVISVWLAIIAYCK